jgi:cytochrome c
MGPNALLEKFLTVKGLYEFVKLAMPYNAGGSLSDQEYFQVVGYLINENKLAGSSTRLDPQSLDTVALQKTQ